MSPARSRPGERSVRLRSLATTGMAVFTFTALVSMIVFLTIGWPGDSGRYVIAVFLGSLIGLAACASAAIFTAASDTYLRHGGDDG